MGTMLASVSRFSQSFSVVQRLAAILPSPIRQVCLFGPGWASAVCLPVGHTPDRTGQLG